MENDALVEYIMRDGDRNNDSVISKHEAQSFLCRLALAMTEEQFESIWMTLNPDPETDLVPAEIFKMQIKKSLDSNMKMGILK